ncbi:hypothetical protein [Arthrobacter sp. NIO-1057]|uniref:hypothetical protein n=1 Tax=Arthrobacter sp. NIO-1057 TaxID=993071 RepID=UPI0008180913|nr:hypothetical protein [Arthrobacter sp. NIO-1057]SCC48264.1 hypothetical protein GA0061084_2970 [Arthrobacter sp. NIO-1057]
MNKPYIRFTSIGLLVGSIVVITPWLIAASPTTLVCQVFGLLTLPAFGFLFGYAAHISSPVEQETKTNKRDLAKAI